MIEATFEDIPTEAYVNPVRCADCRYRYRVILHGQETLFCARFMDARELDLLADRRKPEDFCSGGEYGRDAVNEEAFRKYQKGESCTCFT